VSAIFDNATNAYREWVRQHGANSGPLEYIAALTAELAAANARTDDATRLAAEAGGEAKLLRKQLAASQAREAALRTALEKIRDTLESNFWGPFSVRSEINCAKQALSAPGLGGTIPPKYEPTGAPFDEPVGPT
jgi:transposase-like protein